MNEIVRCAVHHYLFCLNQLCQNHMGEGGFCLSFMIRCFLMRPKCMCLSYIVPGHIHAWLQSFLLQSPHTFGSPIKEGLVERLIISGSLTWSRVCPRRWRCPPRCRRPHAWRTPPSLPVGSPEMWKVAYKNLTISNHFMKLRIYATQLAIWITSDMESLIKIYPTMANWLLV